MGTADDDTFYPGGGWDVVEGGLGIDTVVIIGRSSQFDLVIENGLVYIDATSGASASTERTELINVELVQFLDKTVNLVANDTFTGQPGTDLIDGGLGTDTVVYSGPLEQYTVNKNGNRYIVSEPTGSDDTDYLTNIERLQFKDKGLAFDLDKNAGVAAKTLGLVFGSDAVALPNYVGICLDLLERQNYSQTALMQAALNVRLGADASNPGKVVDFLFTQLTGALPSSQDKASFVNLILNQTYSIESLAVVAAELSINPIAPSLVGLATNGLPYVLPS